MKNCITTTSDGTTQQEAALRFVETLRKVVRTKLVIDNTPPSPQIVPICELMDIDADPCGEKERSSEQTEASTEQNSVQVREQNNTVNSAQQSARRDSSGEKENKKRFKILERRWKALSKHLPPANDVSLPEACCGEGIWKYLFNASDVNQVVTMVRNAVLKNIGVKMSEDEGMNNIMLRMFMDSRKKDIQYQGYTVCKGILAGCDGEKWISDLVTYYMNFFPGLGGLNQRRKNKQVPWDWICNVGDETDAALVKDGIGRYQINSSKDILYLFKNENELLKSKSKLEVFVASLINHILHPTSENQIRLPVFGSKIIVHTDKADPQKCHCDYEVTKGKVLKEEEAKYFAVATGENTSYLHVWPTGHIILSYPDVDGLKMKSELLEIPPYSVCLLRGDFPHAGAGAKDDEKMRGKFELSPRVHFYIDREEGRPFITEPNELFFPTCYIWFASIAE